MERQFVYVRAVKSGVWKKLVNGGSDALAEARDDLLRKGTDVSVFECESRGDLELCAVALSAMLSFPTHFDYIEIDPAHLVAIPVSVSLGSTPLPSANHLHRDLDLSSGRAELLVGRLQLSAIDPRRIRRPELQSIAKRLRDRGEPIPEGCWLLT